MQSGSLFRISAIALVTTGLMMAAGVILHPTQPFTADEIASGQWMTSHLFWSLGGMASAIGLTGLYLRQRAAMGLLGFIGACFAILGSGFIASAMYFEAFIAPSLADRSPELFDSYPSGGIWTGFLAQVLGAGFLLGLGLLLFGIRMIRVRSMPRWAVLLTLLGGVPFSVNFLLPHAIAILAAALLAVGLLRLGFELWVAGDETATQQTMADRRPPVTAPGSG